MCLIKGLLPEAIKRPVRNYLDRRRLKEQPRLDFRTADLRVFSESAISAAMNDPVISAAFAKDSAAIAGATGKAGEISGGVNPGDRRALYHIVAYFRPMSVLEIGTHVGASTLAMAMAMRRFGGTLTTADIQDVNRPAGPWASEGLLASPLEIAASLGLGVKFITSPATRALKTSNRYDMIFLDGDHSASAVYCEIHAALGSLNPSGFIMLHDFYPGRMAITPDGAVIDGPALAAERIKSETDMLDFFPLGRLPWQTKGGGDVTSLAIVARRG